MIFLFPHPISHPLTTLQDPLPPLGIQPISTHIFHHRDPTNWLRITIERVVYADISMIDTMIRKCEYWVIFSFPLPFAELWVCTYLSTYLIIYFLLFASCALGGFFGDWVLSVLCRVDGIALGIYDMVWYDTQTHRNWCLTEIGG